jgi:hypothetical protein
MSERPRRKPRVRKPEVEMPTKKAEVTEQITVEVGGTVHTGTIYVRGTRFREFVVEYNGRRRSDGRKWGLDAEERRNMMVMAEATLMQMVHDSN